MAGFFIGMNYFLDTDFSAHNPVLNPEETKHAIRSLRLKTGDKLIVGNGCGIRYRCALKDSDGQQAQLDIISEERKDVPKNQLTIAIAPTKNPSRFEWFLEKATEMGVWEFQPLISQHSERPRINEKRASKIIHAAAKQSQRYFIPRLLPLTKLKKVDLEIYDHIFLAHCNSDFDRSDFKDQLQKSHGKTLVMIGPEGDFSEDEIKTLQENRATGVSLGNNRLRTETAGVFVAAIYSSMLDN